jgi:hypothetical protein
MRRIPSTIDTAKVIRHIALLSLLLLALCSLASASSCVSGTVATVEAQGICTIGNLTFDFTSSIFQGYVDTCTSNGCDQVPIDPSTIGFTPILNSGFTLSGIPSATGILGVEYQIILVSLGFTATVPPNAFHIQTAGALVNGHTFTGNPIAAGVRADNVGGFDSYSDEMGIFQHLYYLGQDIDRYLISGAASVQEESDAGTVSLSSADYTFTEIPAPEPGSLMLAGSGILALGGVRKRFKGL